MKQKNGGRGFENISIIFYCKFLFCGCFGQLRFYLILKDFSAYVCFYTSICLCRKCAPITNIKCSSLSCVVFSLLGTRLSSADLVFGLLLSNYCAFYTCCQMFKKQSGSRFKANILSTGSTAFYIYCFLY